MEFRLLRQILALSFGNHRRFHDCIQEFIKIAITKLVNGSQQYYTFASECFMCVCVCQIILHSNNNLGSK